jgi:hypothetical protein
MGCGQSSSEKEANHQLNRSARVQSSSVKQEPGESMNVTRKFSREVISTDESVAAADAACHVSNELKRSSGASHGASAVVSATFRRGGESHPSNTVTGDGVDVTSVPPAVASSLGHLPVRGVPSTGTAGSLMVFGRENTSTFGDGGGSFQLSSPRDEQVARPQDPLRSGSQYSMPEILDV